MYKVVYICKLPIHLVSPVMALCMALNGDSTCSYDTALCARQLSQVLSEQSQILAEQHTTRAAQLPLRQQRGFASVPEVVEEGSSDLRPEAEGSLQGIAATEQSQEFDQLWQSRRRSGRASC